MPKASFQPAVGPPIDRPRGTMRLSKMTVAAIMTDDQVSLFEDFVFTELGQATQPFNVTHPRTGEMIKVRMLGDQPYQIAQHAPGWWRVTFEMMVLG